LNSNLQDARHLLRLRNHFAIVAAFTEKVLRMRLLEVVASNLPARNVCSDSKDGHTAAMTIAKAVDEMHVTRATATRAYGKASRQMRLGASGKCRSLLVPHRYPLDAISRADRIGNSIQRITSQSIDSFHSCFCKSIDKQVCDSYLVHSYLALA
jgi:hypothetical protein